MSYLGSWAIDALLTFCAITHATSGALTDADAVPAYRVYEDETGTAILTGNMAKLDDANTTGFYSDQITLSPANGFEQGKSYSIYISAVVGGVTGGVTRSFQVGAAVDVRYVGGTVQTAGDLAALITTVDDLLDTEVAAIKAKTDNLPADPADASDLAALMTTVDDLLDTEIAAIKAVTDALSPMIVAGEFTEEALVNAPGGTGTLTPTTLLVQTPLLTTAPDWDTQVVEVSEGDTLTVRLDCVDSNGVAINLTGKTVTGKLYDLAGVQVDEDMDGTAVDASGGRVSVFLTADHTAEAGTYRLRLVIVGGGTQTVGPVAVKVTA